MNDMQCQPKIVLESSSGDEEYHRSIFAHVRARNCSKTIITNLYTPIGIILLSSALIDALLSICAWILATGKTFYLDEKHFPTEWLNPLLLILHYITLILGVIGYVLNFRLCLLIYTLSLLIQCNFLLFDMFVRFDLIICSCFACKSFVFILTVLSHLRLDNRRIMITNILYKQMKQQNNCQYVQSTSFVTDLPINIDTPRRGSV